MTDWTRRTHWIFDMDGTLTVPAHDFAGFKYAHDIPLEQDLLAAVAEREGDDKRALLQSIDAWERRLARSAEAQSDAVALLDGLNARGARLAVLTRNTRDNALITLKAAGLDRFFPDEQLVMGRDCAAAKPDPAGIHELNRRWDAAADQVVMVGDWVHDVAAGRAAGCATALVVRHGPPPEPWLDFCDRVVEDLTALL